MSNFVLQFAESTGYWGIALLMLAENVFPPIPSEVVMPWAGFATHNGELNFVGVVIAGSLGSLLGALPWYYLGKWVGRERLLEWVKHHGAWLAITSDEVQSIIDWFERRGKITVTIGRLVPGVRTLISVPAGLAEMPLPTFLASSAIGILLWNVVLAWLGWTLGDQHELVNNYLGPLGMFVIAALACWWIVRVVRQKRWRRRTSS